jgi:hypothetical protein
MKTQRKKERMKRPFEAPTISESRSLDIGSCPVSDPACAVD